jgi:hypothetical protein
MLECSNLQATAEVLKRFKKAPARLQLAVAGHLSVRVSILDAVLVPFTASLVCLTLLRLPISEFRGLPSGLFPSLERLVLYIDWQDDKRSTRLLEQPIVAFESAPVLRRVATNSLFPSKTGMIMLCLPWNQLTHLIQFDYGKAAHRFLIEVFPQCVALQWLHIFLLDESIGQPFGEPRENQPIRTMQNLKSMTLNFFGTREATLQYPDFFDNVKLPGLRSLRLEGGEMDFDDDASWDPNQVDRFLGKLENELSLEYLSICHSPITRTSLERLFKATPFVTTLDAHIYRNYGNLFETLTIDQDTSQYFLPRLKTLVLELGLSVATVDGEGETIDFDAFAEFLDSRMRCVPDNRLRKIVLYSGCIDDISDEVPFVGVIQQYLSEGLSLERHVVAELRDGKLDDDWMERDPDLQDWLEANAVSKNS